MSDVAERLRTYLAILTKRADLDFLTPLVVAPPSSPPDERYPEDVRAAAAEIGDLAFVYRDGEGRRGRLALSLEASEDDPYIVLDGEPLAFDACFELECDREGVGYAGWFVVVGDAAFVVYDLEAPVRFDSLSAYVTAGARRGFVDGWQHRHAAGAATRACGDVESVRRELLAAGHGAEDVEAMIAWLGADAESLLRTIDGPLADPDLDAEAPRGATGAVTAIVFTAREWPLASRLHRLFELPASMLDVPCYVVGDGGVSPTIHDRVEEPASPVAEDVWNVLLDRFADAIRSDALGANLGDDDPMVGAHLGVSREVLARSLEADGYEVVLLADALRARSGPTEAHRAFRERCLEELFGSAAERRLAKARKDERLALESARRVRLWLETGEGSVSDEDLARTSVPPLSSQVEHWDAFDVRVAQLHARCLSEGMSSDDDASHVSRALMELELVGEAEGIVDRFHLLSEHLARGGTPPATVARLAFVGDQLSRRTSLLALSRDLDAAEAAGARVWRDLQRGPEWGTWLDHLLHAAKDLGHDRIARRLASVLDVRPELGSAVGGLALLELDEALAPSVASQLARRLEAGRERDPLSGIRLAEVLHDRAALDAAAYDRALELALRAGVDEAMTPRSFRRLPRLAMGILIERLEDGSNPDGDIALLATAKDGLAERPTDAELTALVKVAEHDADVDRARAIAELLASFGVEAPRRPAPRDVSEVDARGRISLDSAVVRIFDRSLEEDCRDDDAYLRVVNELVGVVFSTGSDGTYTIQITGKEEHRPDDVEVTFGLRVASGSVTVAGDVGHFTLSCPNGHYVASVVALPEGDGAHFRVFLEEGAPQARDIEELDVV